MVLLVSGVGIGEARRDGSHGVLSRLEDCSPFVTGGHANEFLSL